MADTHIYDLTPLLEALDGKFDLDRSGATRIVQELLPALGAHVVDVRAEALRNAAKELRREGTARMTEAGPHDARGAALWDAGCHIDPDDVDALKAGGHP